MALQIHFEWQKGTISFGEYLLVSLEEARKKKDESRALLKDDINPVDEKKKKKIDAVLATSNTFKKLYCTKI